MEPLSNLVKVSLANYLAELPLPHSVGGWFRLGGKCNSYVHINTINVSDAIYYIKGKSKFPLWFARSSKICQGPVFPCFLESAFGAYTIYVWCTFMSLKIGYKLNDSLKNFSRL